MRSGISNLILRNNARINLGFDNLYDLVLTTVNNKWNTFIENKSLQIEFEANIEKTKIILSLDDCDNRVIEEEDYFTIILDETVEKEDILNNLAHEITHVSQFCNGFMDYEIKFDYESYLKSEESYKMDYQSYYEEISHKLQETEHEAVLAQVFNYMEHGNFSNASVLLMETDIDYFVFSNKIFLKKAVLFGLSKTQIDDLRSNVKKVIEFINLEYRKQYIEERKNVLDMLNIFNYIK